MLYRGEDFESKYTNRRLITVAEYYGVVNPAPHRAMGDVLTTYHVYRKMQEKIDLFYKFATEKTESRRYRRGVLYDNNVDMTTHLLPADMGEPVKRKTVSCTPSTFVLIGHVSVGEEFNDVSGEIYAICAYKVHNWEVVDVLTLYMYPKNPYNIQKLAKERPEYMEYVNTYGVSQEDGWLMLKEWCRGYSLMVYNDLLFHKLFYRYFNQDLFEEPSTVYFLDFFTKTSGLSLYGDVDILWETLQKWGMRIQMDQLNNVETLTYSLYELCLEWHRRNPDAPDTQPWDSK